MTNHGFILTPGTWSGEGKITLNMIEEELLFNTNWTIQPRDFSGKVLCTQEIQIQGLSEHMHNDLTFYDFAPKQFAVDMENQNIGRIAGAGVVDEKMIAWEFRNPESSFEGYETYTLQDDGSYLMHGEYVTADQFRTQIEARIWPKSKEIPPPPEQADEEEEDHGDV